jgi:hypothetical protein
VAGETFRSGAAAIDDAFVATICTLSGAVFLQHSSAPRDGRHLPLAQQPAALLSVIAEKQSKGFAKSRITARVMAM